MGYFFSRYGFFNALSNEETKERINSVFEDIKLYAFVLYNPNTENNEFGKHFEIDFNKLNDLTGKNLLFFSLVENPSQFVEEETIVKLNEIILHDYNETDKTFNEDITAYSIAQSLKIRYEDLPVIILTNELSFENYKTIKTNSQQYFIQLQKLGDFCSKFQGDKIDIKSKRFRTLLKGIDLDYENGYNLIFNQKSINNILSGIFKLKKIRIQISKNELSLEDEIIDVLKRNQQLIEKINRRNLSEIERHKITMLTSLIELNIGLTDSKYELKLDPRICEESSTLLRTYNLAQPIFTHLNNTRSDYELDYSMIILNMAKILEIEINLSLIQWIRNYKNIDMPKFYNKFKNGAVAIIKYDERVIGKGGYTDFNKKLNGTKDILFAPSNQGGLDGFRMVLFENNYKSPIDENYKIYVDNWSKLIPIRNDAAHNKTLSYNDFLEFFDAFNNIIKSDIFKMLMDIKQNMNGKEN